MSLDELRNIQDGKLRPGCRVEIEGTIHAVWRRLSTGPNWKTFCDVRFAGKDFEALPAFDRRRPTCLSCIAALCEDL